MKNSIITAFEKRQFAQRKTHPEFRAGDTVRISYKIQEGTEKGKYRTQLFEGVVIRFKRGTADSSFTVRKIGSNGIGVERAFPLYSPFVDNIDVLANGIVRRSRLYYLRELAGKAARIRSRFGGRSGVLIPGAESNQSVAAAAPAAVAAPAADKE